MADYEQLVFEGLEWNAGDIQKRQDSIGYSLRYGAFLNDTKAELGHGKWEDYMEAIDVKPTWSKILMSLSKSTLTCLKREPRPGGIREASWLQEHL